MSRKIGAKVPCSVCFHLLSVPRQEPVSWKGSISRFDLGRISRIDVGSKVRLCQCNRLCRLEALYSLVQDVDEKYLRRTIELAKTAAGNTRPNPLVGCVVLSKEGKVVGEGYHPKAGLPHAEVFALGEAGEHARGGTLYVNLEPCNHTGRTPPCTEAILRSGISRVVVGMVDPDPRTSGDGIRRLRSHGIQVIDGIEERACRELNAGFCLRMKWRKPLSIFKYAMSIDGRIATSNGSSRWISNEKSRQAVHMLRSQVDAIIIGGNTVRKDDPQLTIRLPGDQQDITSNHSHLTNTVLGKSCLGNRLHPLRVVVSSSMDLPIHARIFEDQEEYPTMVITRKFSKMEERKKVLRSKGVSIIELDTPTLSPSQVLDCLYEWGALQVLWECGGTLASKALEQDCIHKIVTFIAPKIVGGVSSPSPFASFEIQEMSQAIVLHSLNFQKVDGDFMVEGYFPAVNNVIFDNVA
ncbi:bifunctional diaminohydroxyphosphoribosylaminopyrimidine deaminase /5-amino-6-(5-phosphoribosylamino)uracil reductase [Galdieria sulphuraria]|uniref:Riboflavin biosynthesis protein PYRD, chloroplastic n=1 Tax=Galdieria sulphuraria TaxID=130081 RepID=M2W647_GALSU|nr:bifunctional diaminohydroxyphosphoribosylaminopyrimidine deaminase /5-amino-6-(5-phosphoribosylamino)uracil reductase [Galdieria sulphuraria]EME31236.1 bifunctional diaminohydroxyphosphoribosylaminopyrimidine deaminase /5-amino-6-(5-phosphoribosylamino)uracil reductase [Galdieria sulphuraria]|eukprot:XP_005707756.1 bifunctional diaminohydroxyphosphoribosylaminopyrimidine deaminase /5-amino-6-(5-phosphoribosylamino)uracil reductase [Galdieria sulphuraria]